MTFVELAIFLNFRKFGKIHKPRLSGCELILKHHKKVQKFINFATHCHKIVQLAIFRNFRKFCEIRKPRLSGSELISITKKCKNS